MRFVRLITIGLRLAGAAFLLTAAAQQSSGQPRLWPEQPPALGLFQSRPVFSLAAARHLEGLIVQHEHLTGERIILVVDPWSGTEAGSNAQQIAEALSEQWKLDTTRRGTAALLTLQEKAPGKLSLGYRPGMGLAKSQVASEEDLRRLQEKVHESGAVGSWDEVAEVTSTWMLQGLASPLLEKPEILVFPKRTEEWSRSQATSPGASSKAASSNPGAGLGLAALLAITLGLVIESVRRGVKQEVLLGAQRAIRFTLLDQSRELLGKLRRSPQKNSQAELQIESLRGAL
jgi:hypothetical protein